MRKNVNGHRWALRCAALAIFGVYFSAVQAAEEGWQLVRSSTPTRTALLELYTSEGCSSCPPADQWFARQQLPGDRLVRLAFHVDYWDDLGWPDPYASAVHTARQREIALRSRSHTVYTPQVLLGGAVSQPGGGLENRVRTINERSAGAKIDLAARFDAAQTLRVQLNSSALSPYRDDCCELYAALVQNGLVNTVHAGENTGRTLHHEHVVRKLLGPFDLAKTIEQTVSIPASTPPDRLEFVAFVQNPKTGEVLQALSVPLSETTR